MRQINLKDAVIKIKDGGNNSISVKIGEGNLTYDEKRNLEYKLDRGLLDTVTEGDEVPLELKIDAQWSYITGDASTGAVTIEDALKGKGGAADWESTDDDACAPYAVDIVIEYKSPCEEAVDETITFSDFRYEQLSHDLRAATISVTGKCNVTEAAAVRGNITS